MNFWGAAIRVQRSLRPKDLVRAAILTAIVPSLLAVLFLWQVPIGCDLRTDPATYRWTCMLPGLLVVTPIGVAVLAPIVLMLNRRRARPLPDGWLVFVPATGVCTQILLCGGYLLMLGAAYGELFLAEILFIPQPFVAGAISGAVFWLALNRGRAVH
jgi:hypothetical protein